MEEPIQHPGQNIPDPQPQTVTEEALNFKYFPFFKRKQAVFILAVIGLVFCCTSLYNEYALDDGIIIHQNNYVLKGITGIGDILTRDAYDSFYRRMHASDQLQGGRYRPLAIVSFAAEQEVIGHYRTGYYQKVEDSNNNGVLDDEPTSYTWSSSNGQTNVSLNSHTEETKVEKETGYEYNNYVDLNKDGVAQPNECYNCWDLNRNFKNDPDEDLNQDGIFNEVDCQVKGATFRHFNNIWLYVLACIVLYVFLSKYILKNQQDLAFLAALIFLAHPVHSSVVANVKSRDEILSLLFISLTFIYSFKFLESRRAVNLVIFGACFFLALLSKEYGILMFALVPVAIHIFGQQEINWKSLLLPFVLFLVLAITMMYLDLSTLYFAMPPFLLFSLFVLAYAGLWLALFRKDSEKGGLNTLMHCMYVACLFYLALRLNAVNMAPGVPDTEILNNPYLLANGQQQFATKIYVLLKYLWIAVFPHPLISDYSFASIPYRDLSSWDFILSALIHLALLFVCVRLIMKRHVLGFALAVYFAFLVMVCNLLINIGATMGEPLLFHSMIGFALAIGWLILKGIEKLGSVSFPARRNLLIGSLFIVIFLYGCKTWERNWDWKNDVTLFLKDVKNAPNSVLVLGNAGARWIDLADTKEITGIDLPGINNVPNDYNGQLKITDEDVKASGFESKRDAALYKGIGYLKHAVELHPRYVNGYLNLGLASYKLGLFQDAIFYWKMAENLYPNNPYLSLYYQVYTSQLREKGQRAFDNGDYAKAVTEFTRWTIVVPNEPDAWQNLGNALFKQYKTQKARECWQKARELGLQPGGNNKSAAQKGKIC